MKLSIVRVDGAVYKDGVSYSGIDLSFIDSNIHALQFNDTSNKGWIEFVEDDFGIKPVNQLIEELPQWAAQASAKWDEAFAAEQAAIEAARLATIEAEKLAALEASQQVNTKE